jgi:DNA-binding NarL/FixJ family response regulator
MSILVVEPDDAIRHSLREWLLARVPGWPIDEAASKEEAVALSEARSPRIILVDIADPERDGLKTVREIKEAAPQSTVVALVMHDHESYRRDLASAGASASLLIWTIHTQLVPKMLELLAGGCGRRTPLRC